MRRVTFCQGEAPHAGLDLRCPRTLRRVHRVNGQVVGDGGCGDHGVKRSCSSLATRGPTDSSASVTDVMTGSSGRSEATSWPNKTTVEVSRTPRGDATVISEDRQLRRCPHEVLRRRSSEVSTTAPRVRRLWRRYDPRVATRQQHDRPESPRGAHPGPLVLLPPRPCCRVPEWTLHPSPDFITRNTESPPDPLPRSVPSAMILHLPPYKGTNAVRACCCHYDRYLIRGIMQWCPGRVHFLGSKTLPKTSGASSRGVRSHRLG